MNATSSQLAVRRASSDQLRQIVEEFRAAEPAILDASRDAFGKLIASALPRIQGYALECGEYKGKVIIEAEFDITPGRRKIIRLNAISTPPPWKLEQYAEVRQ